MTPVVPFISITSLRSQADSIVQSWHLCSSLTTISMNNHCPICDPPESCKGYPHLWRRLREDPEKWLPIHQSMVDQVRHPVEYPPLAEQAGNVLAAVGRAVASGFAHVDEVEHERRLAICNACDRWDAKHGRCTLCGCYTEIKTRLATERCPDNPPRW